MMRPILLPLLLVAMASHAQTREIDSLFKTATFEIYEQPDKTIAIGERILTSGKISIRTRIRALVMISDAYSSKRDYRKSVEFLIKAQNLSDKIQNNIVKIQILTKTAIQYQQLRIYDKAIQYLDEARALILDYPVKDSIQSVLGTNYTLRGFIYKEQLDCGIAIDYFDKGLSEYKKVKSPLRNANLSIVSYNKGNCYILLSDNALARQSFNDAIAYARQIDAKSLQAFAQKGLAEVYTLEGNYTEAISELTQAERISSDVGDLVLNQGLYRGLSENYLALNDWDNYQKFQQLYLETQKKIVESERKSVGISLNEQQKMLDLRDGESRISYLILIAVLAAASLVILIITVRSHRSSLKTIGQLKQAIRKLRGPLGVGKE